MLLVVGGPPKSPRVCGRRRFCPWTYARAALPIRIHGTTKGQVAVRLAEKTPALLLLPVEPFRHCQYGEATVLWIGAWNSKWLTFGISRRHARRPVLLSQKPEYLWVCFSAALVGGGAHRAKLVRRHLKGHLAGV